jgi:chromate transporter
MLAVPLVVVLSLALVYARFADNPRQRRAARHGRGGGGPHHGDRPQAVRARSRRIRWGAGVHRVGIATFVGIALLRWPLAYVLLGLGGLACAMTYRKMGKAGA